jgi:O-antigen/teichoic acid export membrane protein
MQDTEAFNCRQDRFEYSFQQRAIHSASTVESMRPEQESNNLQEGETSSRSPFIRGMTFLLSGSALAMLLPLLATPVLTRLFTPEAFGVVAVYTSLIALIAPMTTLRYDKAILLGENERQASSILNLTFLTIVLLSAFAALLFWLFTDELTSVLKIPELRGVWWWFPVGLVFYAMVLPLQSWMIRHERFGELGALRVWRQAGIAGIPLLCGLLGAVGGLNLTGLRLIGLGVVPLFLIGRILSVRSNRPEPVRMPDMARQARRHWRFPVYTTPDTLLEALSREGVAIVLAMFFMTELVGQYSRAFYLVTIPFSVIGMALDQVFYQQAAKLRHDPKQLSNLVNDVFHYAILLLTPIFMSFIVLGPDMLQLFLGQPWREAGVMSSLLAPFFLAKTLIYPLANLSSALERQSVGFRFTGSLLLVQGTGLLTGCFLGSARLALLIYSMMGVVVLLFYGRWIVRTAEVKPSKVFRWASLSILLALVTMGPSALVSYIFNTSLWVPVGILVAGTFVYYLLVAVRHRKTILSVLETFRR